MNCLTILDLDWYVFQFYDYETLGMSHALRNSAPTAVYYALSLYLCKFFWQKFKVSIPVLRYQQCFWCLAGKLGTCLNLVSGFLSILECILGGRCASILSIRCPFLVLCKSNILSPLHLPPYSNSELFGPSLFVRICKG